VDGLVALTFAIAEILALVDDDQAVAPEVGQLSHHLPQGDDPGGELVFVNVPLPHVAQFGWTNDQGVAVIVLLHDSGHGGSHQGFAKAHDISKKHTSPPVQVVSSKRHGLDLKIEQHPLKHLGQSELALALVGLPGEVVGHLEVDMIG